MKLEELFVKAVNDSVTFAVLLPGGEECGNSITLKPIGGEDTALATMRYMRLLKMYDDKFEKEHKELKTECEAAKDFSEYNYLHQKGVAALNKAYAQELVDGWDFDNEFTQDALSDLLDGYPALSQQIIDNFYRIAGEQQKK